MAVSYQELRISGTSHPTQPPRRDFVIFAANCRRIGRLPWRFKLPNRNRWNASCFGRWGRETEKGPQAMEVLKIFMLMALIGAITAASYRRERHERPDETR